MRLVKSKKILVSLLLIVLVVIVYYTFAVYYNRRSLHTIAYAIVIDAGSTGSRIHVFKLYKSSLNVNSNSNAKSNTYDAKLIKQLLFVKVKPGLSAYASEPERASMSIQPLLDQAMQVIPPEELHLSKITLKATAGLRLIPAKASIKILKGIEQLFAEYPFASPRGVDAVSILDGKYEGIYSWLTLNYALNNFEASDELETCSLDLGGGSTQVTFVPSSRSARTQDQIFDFNLDSSISYKFFAKSFLGFGLMSARLSIFLKDKEAAQGQLSSVCLPVGHRGSWLQQNVEYKVSGPQVKVEKVYEACLSQVLRVLDANIDNKTEAKLVPKEIEDKDIYAFSFFYDRLNASAMFRDEDGGQVKLEEIYERAKSICDHLDQIKGLDVNDANYPFLCMDLVWIYALLSKGYGLSDSKKINFHSQVNHMEISWALGQAFHLISN
jgi:Golgi nucleoside diphosphatase